MNFNISSDFFNSMLGRSSGNYNSGLTGLLGDYNAIRNGSYLKLAKHYYTTDGAKEATKKKFTDQNAASGEKWTEDKLTKAGAEGAWKDITQLRSDKVYQTDADGAYQTDTISKNIQKFVDGYNSAITSAQKSDHANVLRTVSRLTAQTERYAGELDKIGLTIQKDNTLKFDKTVFENADMASVKDLFAGDFSFGSSTQNGLLQLASDAGSISSGFYIPGGMTSTSVGSLYDSLF